MTFFVNTSHNNTAWFLGICIFDINYKILAVELKCGHTSMFGADRPGRPNEHTTSEMIEKICDIVINGWDLKVREVAETMSFSIEYKIF